MQHKYEEAEVEVGQVGNHTPEALIRVENLIQIRVKVTKCHHKYSYGNETTESIVPLIGVK